MQISFFLFVVCKWNAMQLMNGKSWNTKFAKNRLFLFFVFYFLHVYIVYKFPIEKLRNSVGLLYEHTNYAWMLWPHACFVLSIHCMQFAIYTCTHVTVTSSIELKFKCVVIDPGFQVKLSLWWNNQHQITLDLPPLIFFT